MNTDEAIRILEETSLFTPLGQAATVGIEAIKENARLRAERDNLLDALREEYECKESNFKLYTHFCDACKQSYENKVDTCEKCSSKNIIEYPF